jgi:hypothetical protein
MHMPYFQPLCPLQCIFDINRCELQQACDQQLLLRSVNSLGADSSIIPVR